MNNFDIWLSVVLGADCSNSEDIMESNIPFDVIYNNRENLEQFGCFSKKQQKKARETSLSDVENIRIKHEKENIKSMNYTDDIFPNEFKNISHAPIILFYKGDIGLLSKPYKVAVVGSRKCNSEGEFACKKTSEDIVKCNGVVVSGLAQGIDTMAIKSAIDNGGKTIGIIGVPLDECYPKTNEKLQNFMFDNHLVVSEYHSGYPGYPSNFLRRNRLVVAISDGVLVVQAAKKSGSLVTARLAGEMGKPLFVVPGSIFSEMCEGTNELLTEGKAIAITDGKQIMKHLGVKIEDIEKSEKDEKQKLEPELQMVLDCIEGTMQAGEIIRKSNIRPNLVKAALTQLEMMGYVAKSRTGDYVRKK